MTRTLICGDREIVFTLKRSRRRRTVALRVEPPGVVTVFAPQFAWSLFIDRFVQKHRDWILKKLESLKDRPVPVLLTEEQRVQLAAETEVRLPGVVARCAERLGVAPRKVKVANQTRRWGSCSVRGDIRFSSRMARLPDPVFEYIVVHELSHLRHLNHSRRFWDVVASVVPDYKVHRAWLRKEAS